MIRGPRSTRTAIAEAEAAQSCVIAALRAAGEIASADRLQRCQETRAARRGGGGAWPWRCRSAGCWSCRRPVLRRWWSGLRHWISEQGAAEVSFCVLPLPRAGCGLRAAVQPLRRALRDLRDRAARAPGGRAWRSVAFAGLALGDGVVWLAVAHGGITRAELARECNRRFRAAAFADLADTSPPTSFPTAAAAELSRLGRGIEPIRIVVAAQRDRAVAAGATSRPTQPLPFLVP